MNYKRILSTALTVVMIFMTIVGLIPMKASAAYSPESTGDTGELLDLAIELPVYQRSVLYAYNSNVIASSSLPAESEMNPYSSPLDRIWEIEFAQ